jgi:hypothetical protein
MFHVVETVNKKYCNIVDIMNHVVSKSIQMYQGRPKSNAFIIFHDGLKQWWEKEGQDHMATLGFRHRQLRCLGHTNIDTIYVSKIVGMSRLRFTWICSFGNFSNASHNCNICLCY